jgi:hypothetical protein
MAYSAKIAEAYVDVKTNTKSYEAGIGRVKGSLKGLAVAAAAAFAAKKIFDFGKSAVGVASTFEETRGRFKTIFAGIGKEAEAASQTIADSFDLADGTAKTMLASTGDLLTGFGFGKKKALEMSVAVAKLGGDLASWSDIEGGAEEAAKRLTSAMLGEAEATKALGIKINQQGKAFNKAVKEQKKLHGITTAQAKALVILKQAQEQSKNALGDYARTSDSFSNQQKKLGQQVIQFKDGLGQMIIHFIKASGVLPLLINKLKDLNTWMKKATKGTQIQEWFIVTKTVMKKMWIALKTPFLMLGTLIGQSLAFALDKVKIWYYKVKDFFKDLSEEERKRLRDLEAGLGNPMKATWDVWKDSKKKFKDLTQSQQDELEALWKKSRETKDKEEEAVADGAVAVEEAEEKKKKARSASFFSAEGLLAAMQKDMIAKKKEEEAAGGGAGGAAAPGGPVKGAVAATAKTKEVFQNILSEIKGSNVKLEEIVKNTAESAVFV